MSKRHGTLDNREVNRILGILGGLEMMNGGPEENEILDSVKLDRHIKALNARINSYEVSLSSIKSTLDDIKNDLNAEASRKDLDEIIHEIDVMINSEVNEIDTD